MPTKINKQLIDPKLIKPTYTLNCKGKLLTLTPPRVMGILNATPDSFFDGGQYNAVDNALIRTEKMLVEGADIIDVGGYSTRPGAVEITLDEELNRVVPVIEAIIKRFPECIISIDTFRAPVAKAAIESGASIINDVSAGDDDELMIPLVARLNVPYIVMHKQGKPQTMQQNPFYNDVVNEVLGYLAAKVALLHQLGVHDVVIDPGFGFGKTIDHNFSILKNIEKFALLNVPILAGVSRKSLINKVLGIKAAEALNGTTVLNTLALLGGANILRVHDVREAKEAVNLVAKYQQAE